MVVPSWQQIPPQHAAIQQPLLSDAGDWGRPLIVDSSTILQVLTFDLVEALKKSYILCEKFSLYILKPWKYIDYRLHHIDSSCSVSDVINFQFMSGQGTVSSTNSHCTDCSTHHHHHHHHHHHLSSGAGTIGQIMANFTPHQQTKTKLTTETNAFIFMPGR
jgi:hypothetical protein